MLGTVATGSPLPLPHRGVQLGSGQLGCCEVRVRGGVRNCWQRGRGWAVLPPSPCALLASSSNWGAGNLLTTHCFLSLSLRYFDV